MYRKVLVALDLKPTWPSTGVATARMTAKAKEEGLENIAAECLERRDFVRPSNNVPQSALVLYQKTLSVRHEKLIDVWS